MPLIKHLGKVVTASQAASCVAKGFRGCSKAEIAAVMKVIQRMAKAARRKRKS